MCHSFWVSKNFVLKRVMSRFCVEVFFRLVVPKNFLVEPLVISQKVWYQRNLWLKWWVRRECQDFWSKTICPTVQKLFVGETFSRSLIKGLEKVVTKGEYQDFLNEICCLRVREIF